MKLKLWQVDAFASKPLEGNPAAIVPLESWLDAGLMQAIAAENIHANDDGSEVRLGFAEWQTIQATQMFLARYMRAVADPNHQADW